MPVNNSPTQDIYTYGDTWIAMVASVTHIVSPVMSLPAAMEAE